MSKIDKISYAIGIPVFIVLAILTYIFKWSWLSYFVCLTTTYGVYLLAKRKPISLPICLISNLIYVYIAYKIKYFGDALFYLLIATPFTIASMVTWHKHLDEDKLVETKKMAIWIRITTIIISASFIFLFGLILRHFGGTNPFVDAASTVTSLLGFSLMILRYKEQWIAWILQYIISVVMYILVKDVLITVMCAFNLIESVLGDYIWEPDRKKIISK